ncbi:tRNA lysidine(34) synthetase TilS [Puniceicoccus vermicola]|uniref:tRNA lysidine(34) synthetase TilS n=1 Tax=Puniceicoccus vermicola TaxID=388746 RepID=UPI0031B62E24
MRDEFPVTSCPEDVCTLLENESESGRVAFAFSGGPDSLFLLIWLRAHFPNLASRSLALHFNHQTRPEENAREAEIAREFAGRLGYRFCLGHRDDRLGSSEESLRRARFLFFQREMKTAEISALLLGHQADDVAETMLARLARGSGPEGLAAPRPISLHGGDWKHSRVRPLLHFSGDAIRSFLQEEGLAAAEDPSNRSDAYLRNRIRSQVIPAWKEASDRDLLGGIERSRRQFAEVAQFLEESARQLVPDGWGSDRIEAKALKGQCAAPVRFAIQRWLYAHGGELVPEAVDAVVRACLHGENGRWSVGVGKWITLDSEGLLWESESELVEWDPLEWLAGKTLCLPDGSRLQRKTLASDRKLYERIRSGAVDPCRHVYLQGPMDPDAPLIVRLWRAGDRFRPLGSPGSRKLQDWFTDRKISSERRRQLPVIAHQDQILWVPGLPPAHNYRLTSPEENLLSLTYEPS